MKFQRNLFFLMVTLAVCACKPTPEKPVRIYITEVESIPDEFGNISKGVSASFAGLIDERLIVAGGCNFPDTAAAEGGKKVFYKDILLLDGRKWRKIGDLPRELAYGVSISLPDGLLMMGGRNTDFFSSAVYRLKMDKTSESLTIDSLLPLPVTADNFGGAVLNDVIYVAGGNQDGKPSADVWSLDLKNPVVWKKCPKIPSRPLVQPVVTAAAGNIYVMGGFDVAGDSLMAEVSQAVWMYAPGTAKWTKVADYQTDINQYSLSGGAAVALSDDLILTLGGVNKTVFEEALNRNAYLAKFQPILSDTLTTRLKEEAGNYMFHPEEWYKFNPTIKAFDTKNNTWSSLGQFQQTALAGSTVVANDKVIYVVNGEIKPGIRTPKIWKISRKQRD